MIADMKKIGRYEILKEVGRGGMGMVYQAHDPELNRDVAIKVIPDAFKDDPEAIKLFKREAFVQGPLAHEHITTVYDVGEEAGEFFIVMEFLEGETLRRLLDRGVRFSLPQKLAIALQICKGLQYAHDRGIIHRDIKPANIQILPGDRVKIMDFGIARIASLSSTKTGTVLGTVAYMSSEQARGEQVDHRTDIFSFGVLLQELLTSRHPFLKAHETLHTVSEPVILHRIVYEEPSPLILPDVDYQEDLQAIVSTCLAKDKQARYRDLRAVLAHLHLLSEKLPPVVPDPPEAPGIVPVAGESLRERLSRAEPLPRQEALGYVKELLGVLMERGSPHGAIKPDHIVLTGEGTAHLIGFDRTRVSDPEHTVKREDKRSLCYHAPEFFQSTGHADIRSDLYAVGMVLYEMLTGRLPFDLKEEALDIVGQIVAGRIPSPDRFQPGLPLALVSVVMRALETDPDKRYSSAGEMLAAIEASEAEGERRFRWVYPGAIACVGLLLAAAWLLWPEAAATLSITTTPDSAAVFVNSVSAGYTPLDYPLRTGEAVSLRVDKERFIAVDTTLQVRGTDTLSLDLRLVPVPAVLAIASSPTGADVWINDRHRGRTPGTVYTEPGPFIVRLEKEGYRTWQRAYAGMPAGDTLAIRETLDRLPIPGETAQHTETVDDRLAVQELQQPVTANDSLKTEAAEPKHARGRLVLSALLEGSVAVFIDDSPYEGGTMSLSPGMHRVRFVHPRYGEKQDTIEVKADQTDTLTYYFERSVNVVALPDWASILIDGENIDTMTTPRTFRLPPGTYEIAVRREGFEVITPPQTLTVEPAFEDVPYKLAFRMKRP